MKNYGRSQGVAILDIAQGAHAEGCHPNRMRALGMTMFTRAKPEKDPVSLAIDV